MAYWLFKSEPDEYSIDDLAAEPSGIGRWDGIRNYQARNNLRDHVKKGDQVFFYHSSCKVPGIAGIAQVTGDAYIDPAQFDPENHYYDPKSTQENPRWYCIDVSYVRKLNPLIELKTIKASAELSSMVLVRQGRLSIQPVSSKEWKFILSLSDKIS